MCFNFHHLKIDYKDGEKWALKDPDYRQLKQLFMEWQMGMQEGNGWNALFWCNHDQPRIVSRLGDEGIYWKESAKMLAGMIHLMRGTPYIYQGEEIGMLNAHYPSIEQYRDVESLNYYQILRKKGKTEAEALEILNARSRDNGRTPMQWNKKAYGGFSDAKPWLPMSEKFREEITVQAQQNDEESILAFYKELIAMRKKYPVIADGEISFIETEKDDILAYQRALAAQKMIVICNLACREQGVKIENEWSRYQKILGNYMNNEKQTLEGTYIMKPYEILVLGNVNN